MFNALEAPNARAPRVPLFSSYVHSTFSDKPSAVSSPQKPLPFFLSPSYNPDPLSPDSLFSFSDSPQVLPVECLLMDPPPPLLPGPRLPVAGGCFCDWIPKWVPSASQGREEPQGCWWAGWTEAARGAKNTKDSSEGQGNDKVNSRDA